MPQQSKWTMPRSWYGLTPDQRDYSQTVTKLAAMYSSPIILTCATNPNVLHNGSGFLFQPGDTDRTFLATNSHVLQCYRAIEAEHGNAQFTFGGKTFDPHIVDEDPTENVDLAIIDVQDMTFRLTAPGYWGSSAPRLETLRSNEWPPRPPVDGEAIVTVGWPGQFRAQDGAGRLEFAAFPILGPFIRSVNETWFAVPFEREEWISSDFDPNNKAAFKTALGGMSGSPVFVMHRPGLQPLQLVGVVRTHGEGLDILYCTRMDIVQADGMISK